MVHLEVTFVHHSRVLGVVLEADDSPRGLNEARWVAHGMGAGMGGEVDRVSVLMVEL